MTIQKFNKMFLIIQVNSYICNNYRKTYDNMTVKK